MVLNLKIKNKKIKVFKFIATSLFVIAFTVTLAACKEAPAVEEQEIGSLVEEKATIKTTPEEITEVEKVNAPEIPIPDIKFDQETRTYINKEGEVVGIYVEDAVEINGKMENAVGLVPKVIREILNENKEKGIFKCPWPFNFQENKDLKMVDLIPTQLWLETDGIYVPNYIAIKYLEPVKLYAPFDVSDEFVKVVDEIIPSEGRRAGFLYCQRL